MTLNQSLFLLSFKITASARTKTLGRDHATKTGAASYCGRTWPN
jgi:hypothetical protein